MVKFEAAQADISLLLIPNKGQDPKTLQNLPPPIMQPDTICHISNSTARVYNTAFLLKGCSLQAQVKITLMTSSGLQSPLRVTEDILQFTG